MTDGTFQRVGTSEKRMYGPPCILVCGYRADEQADILSLVRACGLGDRPMIFATEEEADTILGVLVQEESGRGLGVSSGLSRGIIMSGFTEKELHLLLSTYRKENLPPQLWATLTPISETWTLRALLEELGREAEAFKRRQQGKNSC